MAEGEFEPRLVDLPVLRVAGISAMYTLNTASEIPAQWLRFDEELKKLPGFKGPTYGVIVGDRGAPMRYYSGVSLEDCAEVPPEWETVEVPAQHYVVFNRLGGGAPAVRSLWMGIWARWMPGSGRKPTQGPMVEYYSPQFTADGGGEFEARIPVLPVGGN